MLKNEARRSSGYVQQVLTMHIWCSVDLCVMDDAIGLSAVYAC